MVAQLSRMLVVSTLGALLAGCAATGERFETHPSHIDAVAPGMARIVVFRLGNFQNRTSAASLKLDETEFAKLKVNGFASLDVAPGPHILNVRLALEPGDCNLPLEMLGTDTGYFLVEPRGENAAARTPGFISFLLSQTIPGGVVSLIASDIGAAVESGGRQCGGPFSVVRVLPAAALPVLKDLRESSK